MFKLKRFNRILLFKDLWLVWTHNQRPYLLLIISNKRNFFFWVELEISQIIVKLSLSISIYLNLSLSLRDEIELTPVLQRSFEDLQSFKDSCPKIHLRLHLRFIFRCWRIFEASKIFWENLTIFWTKLSEKV